VCHRCEDFRAAVGEYEAEFSEPKVAVV